MKKTILLLWALLFGFAASAQSTEIRFRDGSMAEILAMAKKENKPVFLDAYAVWCGPCKWMDKNVFKDQQVAEHFNQNFVNYKVDMEKGEGIELAKKYDVKAYPTYLFLNADGSIMHRTVGSRPSEMFMEVASIATDPSKNFMSYQKKYDSGDRSPAFMLSYLTVLQEAALDAGKQASEYLATQKPEELLNRGNWNIIYKHINDVDSKAFKYLVQNRQTFANKYTADSVDKKIAYIYGQHLTQAAAQADEAKMNKLKSELAKLKLKDGERYILMADATYYGNKNDMKNYHAANVKLMNEHYHDNAQALNSLAWKYYQTVDNKAMLEDAEKWSKKSISLNPAYAFLDTDAALLYKLGKKAEALEVAQRAIEVGKKNGEDVAGTVELVDKIKLLQ